jgi:hypothetical protein
MAWVEPPPDSWIQPSTPTGRLSRRTLRNLARKQRPGRHVRPLVGSGKTTITLSPNGPDAGSYQGLSDDEIYSRAVAQADAALGAQSANLNRLRAQAAAMGIRDEQTLRDLGSAQMGLLAPIPQQLLDIRSQAAKDIAGFGAGYTGAMGDQLRAEEAANAASVAQQTGGTAPGAPTISPDAVQNAAYAIGGAIPATESEQIGQASANAAAGVPGVVARSTQLDVMQRIAEAAATDSDYRQQLIDLYAQRPGLVQDAVDRLNQIESARFDRWTKTQDLSQNQEQIDIQRRAELANEAALGNRRALALLQEQDRKANLALKKQQLALANKKQAFAVQQAINKGVQIDPSASKVLGYVVDRNGNPVVDENGNHIPVASKPSKPPTGGVAKANSMAAQMRGAPRNQWGQKTKPRVSYQAAYNQVYSAMLDMGYPPAQVARIARQAVNAHYGPGVGGRPG